MTGRGRATIAHFGRGRGELFQLGTERLDEIIHATSFQCHKTIDYEGRGKRHGKKPQQCAGLMGLLHNEDIPNQIMQVAQRLGGFDPQSLDQSETYASLGEAYKAHGGVYVPKDFVYPQLVQNTSNLECGSVVEGDQPSLAHVARRRQGNDFPAGGTTKRKGLDH